MWALVFFKVRLLVSDFSSVKVSSIPGCVVLRCLPLLGLGLIGFSAPWSLPKLPRTVASNLKIFFHTQPSSVL